MDVPQSSRQYYPALDGIRGLAILMVIAYHYLDFTKYHFFGWLGVDLFFVLSGYLITKSLLQAQGRPNFLRNFFIKRALRIFPLYYLSLLIFLVLLPLAGLWTDRLHFYTTNWYWFVFYLQNWLFTFNFDSSAGFLNHFWSLAIEEQFYLIWPFLILYIKNPGRLVAVMLLVLLSCMVVRSLLWINYDSSLNYTTVFTFTRIDGICFGSIVALIEKKDKDFIYKYNGVIILCLAIINFAFYFLNKNNNFPYYAFVGYTTFAAMFALLVYTIANSNTHLLTNMLNWNPLTFLGKVSYGLYVYHWPIYLVLFPILRNNIAFDNAFASAALSAFLCFILSLLLSYFSFQYFEKRFLQLKQQYT